jgi:hypothetical protein
MFFSKLRFIFDVSSIDTIVLNPEKLLRENDFPGLFSGSTR